MVKTYFCSLTITLLLTSQSFAKEVCNHSPEKMFVAGAKTWNCTTSAPSGSSSLAVVDYCHESSGWWELTPGQCRDLPYQYFFADGMYGSIWAGDSGKNEYCINKPNGFKYNFNTRNRCDGVGGRMVSFSNATNFGYGGSKIRVCNYTSDPMLHVSIARYESDGWTSNGWQNVAQGKCNLTSLEQYSGKIYFFANTKSKSWGGDANARRFCIDNVAFKIRDADYPSNCFRPGQRMQAFREANVAKDGLLNLEFK